MTNKYDVIIIGSGIGGLACGLYLANEGYKTLILEQHKSAGGYCSSFKRNGYTFDSAVHYLGSCREGGWIGKFMTDHDLWGDITLKRSDPSDVVIMNNTVVPFHNDVNRTISILVDYFPNEASNIKDFFDFIRFTPFISLYTKLKNISFQKMLDSFFLNKKLKSIFSILVGNMELPPTVASALAASILFREFILDGGYYPQGGMQKFADALVEKFKSYKGEIRFSNRVESIDIKDDCAGGVKVGNNIIYADKVVANCDANQLFTQLMPFESRNHGVIAKIKNLIPSASTFIVYLGLNRKLNNLLNHHCSTWFFPGGNVEKIYSFIENKSLNMLDKFVFCAYPSFHDAGLAPSSGETMMCIIGAPFQNSKFWDENREALSDNVISRVERFIPSIRKLISVTEIATPHTFYRYTSNYNGALSGWANLTSQIDSSILPSRTYIKNLYMCGHWVTSGFGQGGIGMVVYSGRMTAKMVMANMRKAKHFIW